MSVDIGTPCEAYQRMSERWRLIHDLRGGTLAMRTAAERWLPKEEAESPQSYTTRLNRSFLYGAYTDTATKLRSKPFSKPVEVHERDELPEPLDMIEDDADNQRASLTQFAAQMFDDALDHGLTHVLVDFPATGGAQTLRDEREMRLHPYFVHIKATQVIGWQSVVDPATGRERLTQVRIKFERAEPDGAYGSKTANYVDLWTETSVTTYKEVEKSWVPQGGERAHTFGRIPLYTCYFKRTGFMQAEPPLEDLAFLNLEHWQSSSDQRTILHIARVPFLFETGAMVEIDEVTQKQRVAPLVIAAGRRYSTTNPNADLRWVEHSGASINSGSEDLKRIEDRMQILGMQPLIEASSRTATEVGASEGRTHSAIKAWTGALNDALYDAYWMAAKWVNAELPEGFAVEVWDKFELDARSDTDMQTLITMRANGDISRKRLLKEAKRRGKFGEDFDVEEELSEAEDEAGPPEPSAAELAALAAMRGKAAQPDLSDTPDARDDSAQEPAA